MPRHPLSLQPQALRPCPFTHSQTNTPTHWFFLLSKRFNITQPPMDADRRRFLCVHQRLKRLRPCLRECLAQVGGYLPLGVVEGRPSTPGRTPLQVPVVCVPHSALGWVGMATSQLSTGRAVLRLRGRRRQRYPPPAHRGYLYYAHNAEKINPQEMLFFRIFSGCLIRVIRFNLCDPWFPLPCLSLANAQPRPATGNDATLALHLRLTREREGGRMELEGE